jgi:NADPH2:quinone reductase
MGADRTIDYQAADDLGEAIMTALSAAGADMLFDLVGGDGAASAVKTSARGGRVAMLGYGRYDG